MTIGGVNQLSFVIFHASVNGGDQFTEPNNSGWAERSYVAGAGERARFAGLRARSAAAKAAASRSAASLASRSARKRVILMAWICRCSAPTGLNLISRLDVISLTTNLGGQE